MPSKYTRLGSLMATTPAVPCGCSNNVPTALARPRSPTAVSTVAASLPSSASSSSMFPGFRSMCARSHACTCSSPVRTCLISRRRISSERTQWTGSIGPAGVSECDAASVPGCHPRRTLGQDWSLLGVTKLFARQALACMTCSNPLWEVCCSTACTRASGWRICRLEAMTAGGFGVPASSTGLASSTPTHSQEAAFLASTRTSCMRVLCCYAIAHNVPAQALTKENSSNSRSCA
jgi:hypothetical protein